MSTMVRNDLESLAIALANAKDVENNAKQARIEAEEALAKALGGSDSGSTSARCGRLSVTVKRGWNYKIDTPLAFAKEFPDFVRTTEKVDIVTKAYEEERRKNSDLFAKMAVHVTATPKKVSVELKV